MSFLNIDDTTMITCDRPGCSASLIGIGPTQHARQRDASALAYRKGWQLSHHGADVTVDLCPPHVEPTLAMPMKTTKLYDCYGVALERGRR